MSQDAKADDFVRDLTKNSQHLYTYIFGLVPVWSDADEIYQETSTLLWQKYDTFIPGTNFRAWACRVALNKIREYRRARAKEPVCFSEAFIADVEQHLVDVADQGDQRSEALAKCLSKLIPRHRDLIARYYREGTSVKSIAESLSRTTDAVYKALNRIRGSLLDCVQHIVTTEDNR
jgi:RNA polymerase sigma-70 factor (ECF subfamily)